MAKEKTVLQHILAENMFETGEMSKMCVRAEGRPYRLTDGGYALPGERVDFATYFNGLSVEKWTSYTYADTFSLELELKGNLEIELTGISMDPEDEYKTQKTSYGRFAYDLPERTKISLSYPADMNCRIAAFEIHQEAPSVFYGGCYYAEVETENCIQPEIAMVTTTFKKEKYVRRNSDLLKETLFSDPVLSSHFHWKLIDNGQTLKAEDLDNPFVSIYPNRNVGGSGGFSRGMIETLKDPVDYTHVLLMDDDVLFWPECFYRLYHLLRMCREGCRDHVISGAMLEIAQRNIQHEDVGMFRLSGEHGPVKPRYDLNLLESVTANEALITPDPHQYSGWWFCCLPSAMVREDNLPLPFFIRGDDVEYSIRNHAKFITMNGICIWHEGFGTKFSGSMEFYQVHRNDLILEAMHDHIKDVKVIERIRDLFWQQIYKFDYKGASLLLDAVEDYLKGPDFIRTLDGEKCMKDKKQEDNVTVPVTPQVRKLVRYDRFYDWQPLPRLKKLIYDYSCNGQKYPVPGAAGKAGVIPYGWGYYQNKMYLTDVNYAVDPVNDTYVAFKKDLGKYRALTARYNELFGRYQAENPKLTEAYKAAEKEMESLDFWTEYLK